MWSQFEARIAVDRDNQEIISNPLLRHEALRLYVELQKKGCFPYMLEDSNGSYRVCHNPSSS